MARRPVGLADPFREKCDSPMIPKHHKTLLTPASLPLTPPPKVIAITICAKSNAISCSGLHKKSHTSRTSASTKKIVAMEGVPREPLRMSGKFSAEKEVEDGGTKVKVAKSRWTIDRKVGGIWRRTMRMAMVSCSGRDCRTVESCSRGPGGWDFLTEFTSISRWCPLETGLPGALWYASERDESEYPLTDDRLKVCPGILESLEWSGRAECRECPFVAGGVAGRGGVEELLSEALACPLR